MIIPGYLYELTAAFLAVFLIRQFIAWKRILALKYFFTPLITTLAVFIVLSSIGCYGMSEYSILVFSSLIAALIADTLLMIEETSYLKNGIIFFMLGHLFYVAAFSFDFSFQRWNIALIILVVIINIVHIRLMKKYAGSMFAPVAVYIIVIDIMGYLAITKFNNGTGAYEISVAIAAVLFWISDFILSINAFVKKIPHSTVYTWLFYAPAQLLFAWSTVLINHV